MTDFQTLAIRTAAKYDLTDDAAEAALTTYIEQIEQLEDRTIDTDSITDDDADFLTESVGHAQRAGDLGNRELGRLEDIMTNLKTVEAERDPAIRAALKAGARTKDVAAVTGLSRQRIEQIKGA